MGTLLAMRPATISDAEMLLRWRNDAVTRAMSKNAQEIQWTDHIAWLSRRLQTAEPNLFIAEIDGASVGTLRVDGTEVSYTVAPEHRNKGCAKAMLLWAKDRFGILGAEIKPENIPSIRAAKAAGHKIVLIENARPNS